jgi:hypothetical protein
MQSPCNPSAASVSPLHEFAGQMRGLALTAESKRIKSNLIDLLGEYR